MAIIKKYNKENGTTYVYDSVSYWDKEKQQPRSKRKLIGKLDPATGEIVPTGGRGRKEKKEGQDPPVPTDTVLPDTGQEPPAEADGSCDYRQLYEKSQRVLLEKEAAIAVMEGSIARLTREKQELVDSLEEMVRKYRH